MKNFFKKLALALAFVMVATSVNVPAASAATAPTFKSTKATVKVGQTKKYNTVNASKYSVKFKIGKTSVATIRYSAGSKAVKVTGVAEGNTTLRADFKSYKTKKVTTVRIPVTVVAGDDTPVATTAELSSVKQTAANAFEAAFTADASQTFTADSFSVVDSTDSTYTIAVKSVEFSTDGLAAKVTTFGNFVDKTTYNVTCGEKTASFVASIGAVKTAVIDTVQAQVNVATDIEFTLYDENGIDVTPAVNVDSYVTLTAEGSYSDINVERASAAKITLSKVGDTATVTLTYDPLAADGTIVTATGTITCVAAQATTGSTTYFTMNDAYAVSDTDTPKIYLNSFAADTTLYNEDGANVETFYFTALDKNGNAIEYDEYTVESSDQSVITVSNDSFNGKYAQFDVETQGIGTAKVVIRATKNGVATVYSNTVIVKPARRLTTIVLDKSSLSIGNNEANDNDKVRVILNDQYGQSMHVIPTNASNAATFTASQYGGNSELTVEPTGEVSRKFVKVSSANGDTGSYVVQVEATDGERTITKRFSVKVGDASKGTLNYKVELNRNSIDLNPEVSCWEQYGDQGKVTVKVAEYRGSIFNKYVTDASTSGRSTDSGAAIKEISISKGNQYTSNTDLTDTESFQAGKTIVTSGSAVTVDSVDSVSPSAIASRATIDASAAAELTIIDMTAPIKMATNKNAYAGFNGSIAETGTYTVRVTVVVNGKEITKTATFTVKNTMEMPTVIVNSTTGDGSTPLDLVKDCVTSDVDVLSTEEDFSIVGVCKLDKSDATFDSNKVAIRFVEVKDTFAGLEYHYYVPVSRTFKVR